MRVDPSGHIYLALGSKGNEVRQLQQSLVDKGFTLSIDGDFGAKTENAVLYYQKTKGLAVDGIVGDKTWGILFASKNLPVKGEPGSTKSLPNTETGGLWQERRYGPDGRAEKDRDYDDHGTPDVHTNPHDHYWDWSKKIPRGGPEPASGSFIKEHPYVLIPGRAAASAVAGTAPVAAGFGFTLIPDYVFNGFMNSLTGNGSLSN